MNLGSFSILPKSVLGIDIGTFAVKVVELSKWGPRLSLKNYGQMSAETLYANPFRTAEKNSLSLAGSDIARALRAIFQEAKMSERRALFSLPDFSSFFTRFELPPMTQAELPDAVKFEAAKHVPLPLDEITFDWQIIQGRVGEKNPFQILLVAVPKEVIYQYQEIAKLAQLQLVGLEAEVFALIRALLRQPEERGTYILLDIGAQTTTVNLVYRKMLRTSRSIDIGGNQLTARISQALSVERAKAEEQKIAKGLNDQTLAQILSPLLDMVIREIQQLNQESSRILGKEVEKIVLAGGQAQLGGFKEYVQKNAAKPTEIANPFRELYYPPILENALQDLGPAFGVAVGMALRGLE